MTQKSPPRKGRGATENIGHRFSAFGHEATDDGWPGDDPEAPAPRLNTVLHAVTSRSIVSRNSSPDVPFEASINPYMGCEHGCIYCYARPTHAYWDYSPGLDFETQILYKPNAVELLRQHWRRRGYTVSPIALGANTDPYQPVEAELRITRGLLEGFLEHRHPLTITTKGALIERDLDLLAELAKHHLVGVWVSLTSLDAGLKRSLEPRAAGPATRLRMIRKLQEAGVPVGTLLAPIIPAINDHEIEAMVEAAAEAGAARAGWILLRLPHEVAPLFRDWLEAHFPDRAAHVMSLVQQSRGGRDNDSDFRHRMRGQGHFVELIAQRFRLACRRHGLAGREGFALDCAAFRPPDDGVQRTLF
jgi:DNA repair photolyase